MSNLQCKDCPYLWKDEDDRYPCCHYYSLGVWDPAPCEQEDPGEPQDDPDIWE